MSDDDREHLVRMLREMWAGSALLDRMAADTRRRRDEATALAVAAGLGVREIARLLGVPPATVARAAGRGAHTATDDDDERETE